MGRDKAFVEVAGRTMLAWVATALEPVAGTVVVAGRSGTPGGLVGIPDAGRPHLGPLAGVAAASAAYPAASLLAVAVDQPWVRTATLEGLLSVGGHLPVVPVEAGVRQSTCALYPADLGDLLTEELEAGGSLQSLLDRTAFEAIADEVWRGWGEDGRSWFGVDRQERIGEGMERFGPPAA
jgi:molybdopterin-guanine dinucleotide biosynthesis protein A